MPQDNRFVRLHRRCLGDRLVPLAALTLGLLLAWVHPLLASGTLTNCTEAALQVALRGGGFVTIACDTIIPITSTLIVDRPIVLDGTGHASGISGGQSTNLGRLFVVHP